MIKNYLLITFRNLLKNKLYISINVVGMGIAIACCIVAYFNYDFNATFDSNHANAASLYRVNSIREFQNQQRAYGYAPIALGNVIKQNVPDVTKLARYSPSGGNFRIGTELFASDVTYVDPPFFKMFTFDFIEGNGDIAETGQMCISDETARKYFGNEKALGKSITQVLDSGKTREYVVSGVFRKPPTNSSFFSPAYAIYENYITLDKRLSENNWYFRNTLFIEVPDPSRVKAIEAQITPYTEHNNKVREDFIMKRFELDPFVGMSVRDSYNDVPATWTRSGSPIAAVVGIGVMGILVLLLACFNLTNTAVAISSRRLKEIGIRKVMGSTRKHLIAQFIGETMFICFMALVAGILIGETLLIPAFNELWPELKLATSYFGRPNFLIFIIATLLFTGLLAGSYPAFYISKFQPISILKGTMKFGGTNLFTRILLMLQFAISLSGIVCSFAFTDNAKFQREFDLGFNKKELVFTYVSNRSEYETYRNVLLANPDILAIAGSENHLYSSSINDPIKHDSKEVEADILNISAEYIKTVGLTLVDGRDFVPDSETDHKQSVIITEGLARKLDMAKPIGQEIIWMDTVRYYVVGVVKDIYNRGLWDPMEPIMFRYGPKDKVSHILVSTTADKIVSVNKFMEAKWKEMFPNKIYNGRFMDEEMVEANTVNNNIVTMFIFLGVVALLLSVTGLFTMVSLNIIKKMKEIGVRKVLGASMANISKVINLEFAIILGVSCVVGGVFGAFMATTLMGSIWKYYQGATTASLFASAAILFSASALSIGYKVYSTTKVNPATVLRDE